MSLTAKDIKAEVEQEIKELGEAVKIAEEAVKEFHIFKAAYIGCVKNLYLAQSNHMPCEIDLNSGLFMLSDNTAFKAHIDNKFYGSLIEWLERDRDELFWWKSDCGWVHISIRAEGNQ